MRPGTILSIQRLFCVDLEGEKMKPFKSILTLLFISVLLSACGAKAATPISLNFDNPYAPQASDSALMIGDIRVDSASISMAKSQPPQLMVNFAYFQPTPCYKLRVEPSGPDDQNHINLKAYAVAEKDKP